MEHARKRTHSRNLLVASLRRGCNAVRRGCRLHEAPPPHCNLCLLLTYLPFCFWIHEATWRPHE